MKKERVISPTVGEPPEGTWSNCLVVGQQVFIAGMTSRGASFDDVFEEDAYAQARTIFQKISDLMDEAGGSINDLVKIVVYLTDIDDRNAVWQARREFFTGHFPVSTLFEVSRLVRPEMKVEIDAFGMLGCAQ
ncbi:MAG: 2-iminobutanoate/2-iminopropanoate deaminase [Gammaproteobacteria bacterium]|jgi:2-iminobutanoate/2-iminopropanoate deaminase